ncbi:MAG: 4-hydroxy-3-methylbut-2-enyl diphosphate reductase [Muribaculaceae bacterium]|nr:4-hydroxy-3-methylbut-2-enyl diphosphate reductase [Muribaculaceae bacterium]
MIEIDKNSGFCFGVVTAIRKAEEVLNSEGQLYCLGDIVHNAAEVERLRAKGLITITHEDLKSLNGVKVLLRAHGEPPSTYELARKNNIEIIDATCPVVLQLQQRIKDSYLNTAENSTKPTIIIYGKRGHAEVNGLVGQTSGEAIVVQDLGELDNVNLDGDIILYSQTTKSLDGFNKMVRKIADADRKGSFTYYDTICRQVANRMDKLRDFAENHDLIVFVAGTKSSNGKVLYSECKRVNPCTYMVAGSDEINPEWIVGAKTIGVCGATSTPHWLMEEVAGKLERYSSGEG